MFDIFMYYSPPQFLSGLMILACIYKQSARESVAPDQMASGFAIFFFITKYILVHNQHGKC